jgi:hypothetical protein
MIGRNLGIGPHQYPVIGADQDFTIHNTLKCRLLMAVRQVEYLSNQKLLNRINERSSA